MISYRQYQVAVLYRIPIEVRMVEQVVSLRSADVSNRVESLHLIGNKMKNQKRFLKYLPQVLLINVVAKPRRPQRPVRPMRCTEKKEQLNPKEQQKSSLP